MDHRTARKIQLILLIIGALVGCVGAWGFNNTIAVLIGLGIMVVSVIVWWLFYRCPFCHEQLGRTDPQRCPRCGAWIGEGPEPGPEKKKIQHKKKKH